MSWENSLGPLGKGKEIKPGDCISSIAVSKGLTWKEIWEHSDNTELNTYRMHPNILLPGDKVTIPKKTKKEEDKESENRHRMRLRGVPGILRLRFTRFGQPRKGEAYRLDVDNYVRQGGKLDDDGAFEAKIWPAAQKATVLLGKDQDNLDEEFNYKLGWIAPANEPRGVMTRLWNLNYYHGELYDVFDEEAENTLRKALLRFVEKNDSRFKRDEWANIVHYVTRADTRDNLRLAIKFKLKKHAQDIMDKLVKAYGC
jgi:hypothetical protein